MIVIPELTKRFRQVRDATPTFIFGICLCLIVAGFLTFLSFVVLFLVVPFLLLLGIPTQIGVVVLDTIYSLFQAQTSDESKPELEEESKTENVNLESPRCGKQQQQQQQRQPSATYSPLKWITPIKSAFTIFKDNTPSSSPLILGGGNTKPLPSIENVRSETLEQLRTPLILSVPDPIVVSPNVLGLNFVESPTEYTNYLAILPDKVIDEILAYLPSSYIGFLALVSKQLASRLRFRRIHSGTDYYPLPTFNQISKRPRLGDNTRRLVIHRTFYRPPIKTQWLLEGSEPVVTHAAWKTSEEKKHNLLAAVTKSCRQISSLTWNEGRLPLPVSILKIVELRLANSIRHLDISANFNQLVNYLINRHHDPLQTFRLHSITIRDGFTEETIITLTKFLKFSDSTIRRIHFKDSNFTRLGTIRERPPLFAMLCELPRLECIDFTRPLGLDMAHIPISHIGLQKGLALNIHNPIAAHTPYIHFEFFSPLGHILSNLTTIILYIQNHINTLDDIDTWHRNTRPEHYRTLAEVISAAVNLRVFAFNAPVPIVLGPLDSSHHLSSSDGHGESNSVIKLPSDILEALIMKDKLVSLSLMARVMAPHQLQRICENLPTLSHLGVFMADESIHVSKYSQHFTKLPRLIALDVAIRSFDEYCPCGHEKDPRFPHYEEGTAMGRLCTRFLPRVDMSGQEIPSGSESTGPGHRHTSQHIKIVRLSRLGWDFNLHTNELYDHEINWFCHRNELVDLVEDMWGPCEVTVPYSRTSSTPFGGGDDVTAYSGASISASLSDVDVLRSGLETIAVKRIFTPSSWIDFHPDSLSEMK